MTNFIEILLLNKDIFVEHKLC